jgi:hypothetical protein
VQSLHTHEGTWKIYHAGPRPPTDPIWERALDIIKAPGSNWIVSRNLALNVTKFGPTATLRREAQEFLRSTASWRTLNELARRLKAASPTTARAAQSELLTALKTEKQRCPKDKLKALHDFATQNLGPPGDWSSNRAAEERALLKPSHTLLYEAENQDVWNDLTTKAKWNYTYTSGPHTPNGPVVFHLNDPYDLHWAQKPSNLKPGERGKITWKDYLRARTSIGRGWRKATILLDVGDRLFLLALNKATDVLAQTTNSNDPPKLSVTLEPWTDFMSTHETPDIERILNLLKRRPKGVIQLQTANWAVIPKRRMRPPKRLADKETLVAWTPRDTRRQAPPPTKGVVSWEQASLPQTGLPDAGPKQLSSVLVAPTRQVPEGKEARDEYTTRCTELISMSTDAWTALIQTTSELCPLKRPPKKAKPTPPPEQTLVDQLKSLQQESKREYDKNLPAAVKNAYPDLAALHAHIRSGSLHLRNLWRPLEIALVDAEHNADLSEYLESQKMYQEERARNKLLFDTNRTEAYKLMLGDPPDRIETPIATSVLAMRENGKTKRTTLLELAHREGRSNLPPLQRMPLGHYWTSEKTFDGYSLASEVNLFKQWAWPDPEEQPLPEDWPTGSTEPLPSETPQLFSPSESKEEWMAETPATLEDPIEDITWPTTGLGLSTLKELIRAELELQFNDSAIITLPSGAMIAKLVNSLTTQALDPRGLLVNGQAPTTIIATDGSGSKLLTGCGDKGGFGAVVLSGGEVFVVLAGKDCTTSAEMEVAAVLESHALATESTPDSILSLADYMTWTGARLDREEAIQFAKVKKRRRLWVTITDTLRAWKNRDPDAKYWRKHVNSHVGANGHWGHDLVEIADYLALFGKEARMKCPGPVKTWTLAPPPHNRDLDLNLSRPVQQGEVDIAIAKRDSKATDTEGLSTPLLKIAGAPFRERLRQDINDRFYEGSFLLSTSAGTVRGKLMEIPKATGGTRKLTIPNAIQVVPSAILANRINLAMMAAGSVALAQKCNIQGISGADDNGFLFRAAIFDFHYAARKKLLKTGQMRVFFLNDYRTAFPSMEYNVLSHALLVCLANARLYRYLATVTSYLSNTEIVVTQQKISVLIRKLAGAAEGMPDSGLLFQVLIEYLRLIIPRCGRPVITIHSLKGLEQMILEMDYADDLTRVADCTQETIQPIAQRMIDELAKASRMVMLVENPLKVKCFALLYTKGRIVTVDPGLTILHEGRTMNIKAYTKHDWFGINGLPTNTAASSDAAVAKIYTEDVARINNIMASNFNLGHKLTALGCLSERVSEHLFRNTWVPKSVLDRIDSLTMRTIRHEAKVNLPTSYIRGELRLGLKAERFKMLFLVSGIEKLTSVDERVKRLALLIIESPANLGRRRLPTDPPFFHWRKVPTRSPDDHILNMGAQWAFLAHALGVGLEIEDNLIKITLTGSDGVRRQIGDPTDLLKCLNKQANDSWLKNLENRSSTDTQKTKICIFGVSWGDAGKVTTKHERREETAFLRSPKYSEGDTRILISLRLLLWKTTFRHGIIRGPRSHTLCVCGSTQTATHLLEIPATSHQHSLALRAIPLMRHTLFVNATLDWLNETKPRHVTVFQVEGSDLRAGDAYPNHQQEWANLLQEHQLDPSNDGEVHSKPDIVITFGEKYPPRVIILDLCAGSPDKLHWENEVLSLCAESNIDLNPSWFDEEGRFTPQGILALPVHAQPAARRLKVLKTMRYIKRYTAWAQLFSQKIMIGCTVEILALPVSVTGTIPKFTKDRLKRFATDKQVIALTRKLRAIAWNAAIQAFKAWQKEDGHPEP